jgi:hypothetical protein
MAHLHDFVHIVERAVTDLSDSSGLEFAAHHHDPGLTHHVVDQVAGFPALFFVATLDVFLDPTQFLELLVEYVFIVHVTDETDGSFELLVLLFAVASIPLTLPWLLLRRHR